MKNVLNFIWKFLLRFVHNVIAHPLIWLAGFLDYWFAVVLIIIVAILALILNTKGVLKWRSSGWEKMAKSMDYLFGGGHWLAGLAERLHDYTAKGWDE